MRHATKAAPYDFRQARGLSGEQTRELGEHCANLCRALNRSVPEVTGLMANFEVDRLYAASYDEYFDSLPENPIIALSEFGPDSPPLVWQLDPCLVFWMMDAMLGGKGNSPLVREGELTGLERALTTTIAGDFLTTWTHVWPALKTIAPRITEVRQTIGRLGTESLQHSLVDAKIASTIGEGQGLMRLGIPAAALRQLLKPPGSRGRASASDKPPTHKDASQYANTELPVSVQLAHAAMTLGEVKSLQEGDVVMLDRGPRDQVDVAIAGVKKFRGISGLVNGRLAVRITDQAPQ
jgi:flagellar motor switch protein FliM